MKFVTGFVLTVAIASTQTALPPSNVSSKLAFVLPDIFEAAVQRSQPELRPVLRSTISPRWISLNSSVAAQLSNLPNPSPASGSRYSYDPESGAMQRTRGSLGPVLSERAETIGKDKFFFALTHQRFSFDRLDDLDLRGFEISVPISVPAGPFTLRWDLKADALIGLNIDQTTAHFTYGLTHWLDISYALPMVKSSLIVRGAASVKQFGQAQAIIDEPGLAMSASASGLGDGVLRTKARLFNRKKLGFAFATDIRLPIGDEFNYHGAGAYGVKPFVILSWRTPRFAPHLNAGFQWNGESYLASQYPTQKRNLPGQIFYAAGFDAGVSPRLTFAFDLLDQVIISGQRSLTRESTTENTREIYFEDISRHEYNASIGLKAQLRSDLVMTGNLMLRLNGSGLRARAIPLVGLSYLF